MTSEATNAFRPQQPLRDTDVQPPIVQFTRWFGVGLIFYTFALAFNTLDIVTREHASIWLLLGVLLPYLVFAAVFLFAEHLLGHTDSLAPLWLGALLALIAIAAAIQTYVQDGARPYAVETGTWGAIGLIDNIGLPLLLVVPLFTPNRRRARLLPYVAIAAGLLAALVAIATSLHNLDTALTFPGDSTTPLLRYLAYLLPGTAYGFILLVAALNRLQVPLLRPLSLAIMAALAISAFALTAYNLQRGSVSSTWLGIGLAQCFDWSRILVIAVFAGWVNRAQTYASASSAFAVLLLCLFGYVSRFSSNLEGLGIFWTVSFYVIQDGSMLLLALLIAEATTPAPAAPRAHRYARIA